ncbi:N-acetyltransferase domain-containing protein [Stackebrandtia soli]
MTLPDGGTRVGLTAMDIDSVLALFDQRMRRDIDAEPGARVDRTDLFVRQDSGADGWNCVIWSALTEANADAVIAEQLEYFGDRRFEWKLYDHDEPADLAERLRDAGFVPEDEEALLVAPAREIAATSADVDGVRVIDIENDAELEAAIEVHYRVFGDDGGRLRRQLWTQWHEDRASVAFVLALAGDEPVSAARVEFYDRAGFAGLWGGGTVQHWRGRGVYRALVAHRARLAVERGIDYLQVDALPTSEPILRRLGFVRLATTTPYVHG